MAQPGRFCLQVLSEGQSDRINGSIQTRQYQDKSGNNRTGVEIVANNINFGGPKNSGTNGGGSAYPASQPRSNAPSARPSSTEAVPSYSAGDTDDFAVIDDSDALPF